MNKVSVILPTLNERENILPLIRAIHNELRGLSHEILVVDDQSSDGTAQVVMDLQDPEVRVIVRTEDSGYARSIRCGIEQAAGDILILMDSDLNHDPRYLSSMVQMLAGYDCVSGSRFLKGGRMVPAWRGFFSGIFNLLIRLVTGGKMTDNLFGFFAIKREALRSCPFDEIFFGFGDYGIRLLFFLQRNKAKILEFPAVCGRRLSGQGQRRFFKTLCQYTEATWALAGKGRIS